MSELIFGTCGTCHFYKLIGTDKACVRNPPSVQLTPHYEQRNGNWLLVPNVYDKVTSYPMPNENWPACGEHQPKLDS